MKVPHKECVANHTDPLSCVGHREVSGEALAGESICQPLSRESRFQPGMPTPYWVRKATWTDPISRGPCGAIVHRHQVNLSGSVRKRQRPMGRARGNDPVQNDYVGAFKSMGQARRREDEPRPQLKSREAATVVVITSRLTVRRSVIFFG